MRLRSWFLLVLLLGGACCVAFADESPPVVDRDADAAVRQGYEFVLLGNYDGAIRAFRAALRADPGNRKAKFGIGACFIKRGQYKEAMAIHEALYKQYPGDFELLNNFAWLLATASDPAYRDPERAIRMARDALLSAPGNHHVASTLSAAYYAAGDFDRALQSAQEALRLAEVNGAAEANVLEYIRQVEKCRRAVDAFTLMD